QDSVDALVERAHPLVWEVGGVKRVLAPHMKMGDRVLVLLYSTPGWFSITQLRVSGRHTSNLCRVLSSLFDKQLIELAKDKAMITPLGLALVEGTLLAANQ